MPPTEHTFQPLVSRWNESYPGLSLAAKLEKLEPTRFICNLLMSTYLENGVPQSKSLLAAMKGQEVHPSGKEYPLPDGATYSLLLRSHISRGHFKTAVNLYQEMRERELEAELPTYYRLIAMGEDPDYLDFVGTLWEKCLKEDHPRYLLKPLLSQYLSALISHRVDAAHDIWDLALSWKQWPTKMLCKKYLAALQTKKEELLRNALICPPSSFF